MNETPKPDRGWRIVRRILVGLAILATLIAAFYTEEDWRGWHAWQMCKRELAAKGVGLDWSAYIPPPVPDDQNFFAAPKMQEWFVSIGGAQHKNELHALATNTVIVAVITNKTAAANFISWSDQFQPDFDLIREALKRPYARMDGDYHDPAVMPIPNFSNVRAVAQELAQRAKCHLLLGQPDKALGDLTFLNDSRHLLEGAPTGKPMRLVSAMINVAVASLYADTIAKGFQTHAWQEQELAVLQKQLAQVNLLPIVAQSFESESAATTHTIEVIPIPKLLGWFSTSGKFSLWQRMENLKWTLMPRGWIYQNMVWVARVGYEESKGFDTTDNLVLPSKFEDLLQKMNEGIFYGNAKPYNFLAAAAIPKFTKAWQVAAHNQTMINEAQIACALERYRLANGVYPETLDTLVPQFIEKLPHDIIGGQPLHYRRTDDGKFVLYSVGWNEKDDGGMVTLTKSGTVDLNKGDWVWKN